MSEEKSEENGVNGVNGVAIEEKSPRDLGDRKQGWVLLYEDREGGYIGRVAGSGYEGGMAPEVVYADIAQGKDLRAYTAIKLSEAAGFSEKRGQAATIVAQQVPGQAQQQLMPVWAPPEWQRYCWPLALDPKPVTLHIAREHIVHAVAIADLLPVIRRYWAALLDTYDAMCLGIVSENAAGGPGMGRIQLANARDIMRKERGGRG